MVAFGAGCRSSESDVVVSAVVHDEASLPVIKPTVFPSTAAVGTTSSFMVSVHPRGEVSGTVTLTWPAGSIELVDDGTGGDLLAGDRMWSARFDWTPSTDGVVDVTASATVDGIEVEGTTELPVYSAGAPTGIESSSAGLNVIDEDDESFLADRLILITEIDVDYAELVDAADSVDGTVVGIVAPGFWQIAIPAIETRAELEDVIADVSGHSSVIRAEPEFVGRPD
jgi:hypothetical protein